MTKTQFFSFKCVLWEDQIQLINKNWPVITVFTCLIIIISVKLGQLPKNIFTLHYLMAIKQGVGATASHEIYHLTFSNGTPPKNFKSLCTF